MIQCCGLDVRVSAQHPGVGFLGAVHRSRVAQQSVRRIGVVEDRSVERVVTDLHGDHKTSYHQSNDGLDWQSKPAERDRWGNAQDSTSDL